MRRGRCPVLRTSGALILVCVASILAVPAFAQDEPEVSPHISFDQWFAARLFAPKAGTRSTSNQTELPASSVNTTTLVDTSSASDLVGVGLQLADLSASSADDSAADVTSASAVASGYALWAAAAGFDPLDPGHYCLEGSRRARWFSTTLGFDDDDPSQSGESSYLVGAKLKIPFLNWRDPCDPGDFDDLTKTLNTTTVAYANSASEMREKLREIAQKMADDSNTDPLQAAFLKSLHPEDEEQFGDALGQQPKPGQRKSNFEQLVEVLDPDALGAAIDDIDRTPFEAHTKALEQAIAEFERQPMFSLAVTSNQRPGGGGNDDYDVKGILDLGLRRNLKFVLNGGWQHRELPQAADADGGTLALGFEFDTRPGSMGGRRGLRIGASASALWLAREHDRYQGQLKVTIPLLEGLEIPLTIAWADRAATTGESEVRGGVSFSLDTAMLINLLRQGS